MGVIDIYTHHWTPRVDVEGSQAAVWCTVSVSFHHLISPLTPPLPSFGFLDEVLVLGRLRTFERVRHLSVPEFL